MANNLEGGGKTPLLLPQQLEDMGFKLCAFPLSLLGVSVRAMETALQGLKAGIVPQPPAMPTFQVGRSCEAGMTHRELDFSSCGASGHGSRQHVFEVLGRLAAGLQVALGMHIRLWCCQF